MLNYGNYQDGIVKRLFKKQILKRFKKLWLRIIPKRAYVFSTVILIVRLNTFLRSSSVIK